jgi:hypothetical protein
MRGGRPGIAGSPEQKTLPIAESNTFVGMRQPIQCGDDRKASHRLFDSAPSNICPCYPPRKARANGLQSPGLLACLEIRNSNMAAKPDII